jgi:hypothetical protein
MQKTIVRLIVFGDEDLRLMPIYFERLKQWCQLRRLYKWHIMKSEQTLTQSYDQRILSVRFHRWRAAV